MSDAIATYSFLPWLRQGLANQIAGGPAGARAQINVSLHLKGSLIAGGELDQDLTQPVALFGPGDILGVDARAIFRVEPRNWTVNYEPNYLPSIEFYAEDFPWRYTPAAAANGRLTPWLALVVLEETEFAEGTDVRNRPLPYIEVQNAALFPPADQSWAWAHVHVNRGLAANDAEFVSTDMGAVLPRLQAVLNENPDLAYSRIVCPRKLDANKAYHAFLMPAFESGRRAGLGHDPNDPALADALTAAWANVPNRGPEPTFYPHYYRWWFRTGGVGDFESLVRLLKPQPVDHRVGRRDMDVTDPAPNIEGVQAGRPDLGGILKLGGALKVPDRDFTDPVERAEVDRYENWATPYPQPIQNDIAAFINLADDYDAMTADAANLNAGITDQHDPTQGDPDPLVTAPLYGRWHALTNRLLVDRAGASLPHTRNWVHELNLDPRFRVAAAFGTRVIQENQEKYMNAAWQQIGRVLDANARIRRGQVAREVSLIWHQRHIGPLREAKVQNAVMLMAPLNKRVVVDGATVHQALIDSPLQPAMTSAAMRRAVRPRARLMRLTPFTDAQPPHGLLASVNAGNASAAPPRQRPAGIVTPGDVAKAIAPQDAPPFVVDLIRRFPALRWVILLIALLLLILLFAFAPVAVAAGIAIVIAVVAWILFQRLSRWTTETHAADAIGNEAPPPQSIDDLPPASDFVITDAGSTFTPHIGGTDSVEATKFKTAIKDVYTLVQSSASAGHIPPKRPIDIAAVSGSVFNAINPLFTIPRRVLAGIVLPPRVVLEIGDAFVEAMAYPEIDVPMYRPLEEISKEMFLPNINYVAQNSVTLVESNQKFIEAYMVGLNHEFARELLWREYPTDQRGSYFRQFWDVSGYFDSEHLDPETLKEKLRDIPRLDHWSSASALGDHDNRASGGARGAEVVLVIRGELLKRYPTAVIYAQHAVWFTASDGSIVRRLDELTGAENDSPPPAKVRTPLYEAKVDPDIYFFGFDLTADEARGSTGPAGSGDAGWFFVIKERPGEPRFGLDIDAPDAINVWNDLSWPDVQPGAAGSFIDVTHPNEIDLIEPPVADEKHDQYTEDVNVAWRSNAMSAADLAYILFQVPVLVAIHAKEMLAS